MAKIITQIPSIGNGLHNDLNGLNEGDYQHLTELEKNNLEFITNKQDSLDTDITNTKYPTVNAVISGNIQTLLEANQYTDGKIVSVYKFKGNVTTYTELPISGNVIGDVWNVLDTDINYAWTGSNWDNLGGTIDVSSKEDKSNKQNSLLPDGTGEKYITVDATLSGLENKLEKGIYEGNAQDLKTEIDNIYQPNVLISSVPPSRSINTFTYPSGQYQALINKVIVTNTSSFITLISPASTDYKRVDLIYLKSDGTLDKMIGVESLTTAVRPDTPVNSVPVSFINVFGNIIETPTIITSEISIQDVFGNEQFKVSDYMRFEGVSMNSAQKLISINPLVPLSAFLDVVNGNDVTAAIENSSKPFKTFNGLLNKLPATTGETYTIYITGGNVPITRALTPRNLKFIAYSNTTLDFSNIKDATGVTDINYAFTTPGTVIWTFENANISIVSNFVGVKRFTTTGNVCPISLRGTLNEVRWNSLGANSSVSGFQVGANTNINILNLYESTQNTVTLSVPTNTVNTINITNYYFTNARAVCQKESSASNIVNLYFANIIQQGSNTGLTLDLAHTSVITNVKIANLSFTQPVTFRPSARTIDLNTVTTVNTIISFQNSSIISGRITGVNYPIAPNTANTLEFRDYTGNLSKVDLVGNNGRVIFENCNLTVDTYLAGRAYNSAILNCVSFKGTNTINQIDTAQPLFKTINVYAPGTMPILIDLVSVTTNATSFGINTNYIKTQSSFKEKINEVVIRNKVDIINKILSSTTKYIIDGTLTLLTGEYIEVPSGGLDLGGYGFDTSSISKNVSGQSIFISPAGNSGNFVSKDISYYPGVGSVFNITDATGGHAIELNDVNLQGVSGSSIGILNGYRQFTGTTLGFYNLSDGLTLEGNWSGFKLTNTNIIGFASTGTLFKKGTATVFSNRFYIDLNLQIATGSKICDFTPSNFTNDKSLQVVNCYTKVNGVIDDTTTAATFPNITPYDAKSYFVNNIGIKNSNQIPYGIDTTNMQSYTNDTTAAAGGIAIGQTYIESSTGYFKKRLT